MALVILLVIFPQITWQYNMLLGWINDNIIYDLQIVLSQILLTLSIGIVIADASIVLDVFAFGWCHHWLMEVFWLFTLFDDRGDRVMVLSDIIFQLLFSAVEHFLWWTPPLQWVTISVTSLRGYQLLLLGQWSGFLILELLILVSRSVRSYLKYWSLATTWLYFNILDFICVSLVGIWFFPTWIATSSISLWRIRI